MSTNDTMSFVVTGDKIFTANFLPDPGFIPGVTAEGGTSLNGGRFVTENGGIVDLPRLTSYGMIIEHGNSQQQLQTITINKGSGPQDVIVQYATGDTWEQALARPENANCGATVSNNSVVYGNDTTIYLMDSESASAPHASDTINPLSTYSWYR